ncbi:MAG: methyltransferase domain-containing protein [Chitinophagaceae bacterium]|nr:methyltransferase domain-containing protein [Chitinophagaceae bacterium]
MASLINEKANELLLKLNGLDLQHCAIDDFGKQYFGDHHLGRRAYFSIASSARIIYDSVALTGKTIPQLCFTDYGAGLGTLYLLAGMLGFKRVIYNDLFPNWSANARIIAEQLQIPVSDYVAGDIGALIDHGKQNGLYFDIIASRNVIEHIYDLRRFYATLYQSQLTGLCYSTTTANYHNPAMLLKHRIYHRKMEKIQFRKQREEAIRKILPDVKDNILAELVELTRGRAFGDLPDAVRAFLESRPVPPVEFLGSNTCDCQTGVWAEHIIRKRDYEDIITKAGFNMSYTPGFWDTHYKYALLNGLTRLFNACIKMLGRSGYRLAPFVNVVAIRK